MAEASRRKKKNNPNKTMKERVAALEANMSWVTKILEKIDRRTWWILGSVVALGFIAILIALIGLIPK